MSVIVILLESRSDNYIFMIQEEGQENCYAVDPGEASVVREFCQKNSLKLSGILVTHHHYDHVEGIVELVNEFNCPVFASAEDHKRIPGIDKPVGEGDKFVLGKTAVEVMDVSGHTIGHIAYYLPEEKIVFSGDTLFSAGCGRMFEGTAKQMWGSLLKIRSLPPETLVYCTHEYTQNNLLFALSIDPLNSDLKNYAEKVKSARSQGQFTVPLNLGEEMKFNPFLRCDEESFCKELEGSFSGVREMGPWEVFAVLRGAKDTF
jgi:hydroxyacylglutathione hydrolase